MMSIENKRKQRKPEESCHKCAWEVQTLIRQHLV